MNYELNLISSRLSNLNVKITPPLVDIHEAIDARRGQHHSTRIIAILESDSILTEFDKILGVTSVDLYNPSPRVDGKGFVFGEARFPGRCGIVSTFRLSALTQSSEIVDSRVKKEVLHELGHMVGLGHCTSPGCVMYPSADVGDTDAKTDDYCDECNRILKELNH